MEKSCLVLYSYLANWGMMRNSFLMKEVNHKHLEQTVRYIAESDPSLWKIDVNNYTDANIERIVTTYNEIKEILVPTGVKPLTVVTKLLLGVYGFVPAFDRKFCLTFRKLFSKNCGFTSCNVEACQCIKSFYEDNKEIINEFHTKTKTIDYQTGRFTNLRYPRAKIIDMYGFQEE